MSQRGLVLMMLLLLCSLVMTACWDQQEIEHRTMVQALGFDRSEDGRFIVMISASSPETRGMGSPGGTVSVQGATSYVLKATGRSPWEALTALESRTARQLWLGEIQAVVFGTHLAQKGIDAALDMLKHQPTVDRQAKLVLADDPESVLTDGSAQERDSASYMQAVFAQTRVSKRVTESIELWEFYRQVANPQSFAVLPLVWSGSNELVFRGLGLFNGANLTGFLSPAETQAYLFTVGQGADGVLVVELPRALAGKPVQVTVRLFDKSHRIRVLGDAQHPRGQIDIALRADVSNISSLDFLLTLQYREPLLRAIEEVFTTDLERAVQTTRHAGSDIFGFGELYRAKYYHEWTTREDWVKRYRQLPIDVQVKAVLGDMGPSQ